jgi:catechol 2,3-dioxygenase-like lactoylglutathione lyase family enzyme
VTEHKNAHSRLAWVTLQVPDVERSRAFWRDAVGLPERTAVPGWVELQVTDEVMLALHPVFHAPALARQGYDRGGPVLGVKVDSLEARTARLTEAGARPLGEPHAVPGGLARDFMDPDGYVLELVELLDRP